MPEFLKLISPDKARELILSNIDSPSKRTELIRTENALGRVSARDILAPHPLPEFDRSSMDGYAVRARDTFGASEPLPAYLISVGEVPMGESPGFNIESGQCALIHTGGMLPGGADAVVMLENTQIATTDQNHVIREIEVHRAVSSGENIIRIGEDIVLDQVILPRGKRLRPADIGGLMALGILDLHVVQKPRVAILSTGDEIVPVDQVPQIGQVRDINSHTLSGVVEKAGGEPVQYGIIPDRQDLLQQTAGRAIRECDILVITAGSSASARDMTADVIAGLGPPGVLVHGINTRPGKPTILGSSHGKAILGLPGNPVSALVNGYLFLIPVIETLLGILSEPLPSVFAHLSVNLASQAGREDWWPVRLMRGSQTISSEGRYPTPESGRGMYLADPIFGKSNLIFSLAFADGLLKIPENATGLHAGDVVEVFLL